MRPICSLLAGLLGLASLASAAAPKPNLIYIMADDLGYGDIGPFGRPVAAATGKPAKKSKS